MRGITNIGLITLTLLLSTAMSPRHLVAAPNQAPAAGTAIGSLTVRFATADVGAGALGEAHVACPSGRVALSGGVDPSEGRVFVVDSGPTWGGKTMSQVTLEQASLPPDGWTARVWNQDTSARRFAVGVTCAVATDVQVVRASDRGENEDSTFVLEAACPETMVAVGGGTSFYRGPYDKKRTLTSAPMLLARALGDIQAGLHGIRTTGWQGVFINLSDNSVTLSWLVRVAAICVPSVDVSVRVDRSSLSPNSQLAVVATCPQNTELLGGGALVPTNDALRLVSTAPSSGSRRMYTDATGLKKGLTDGWRAEYRSPDGLKATKVTAAAICLPVQPTATPDPQPTPSIDVWIEADGADVCGTALPPGQSVRLFFRNSVERRVEILHMPGGQRLVDARLSPSTRYVDVRLPGTAGAYAFVGNLHLDGFPAMISDSCEYSVVTTSLPSPTPSWTPSRTPTRTPSATKTPTLTPTATGTPSPTPTNEPSSRLELYLEEGCNRSYRLGQSVTLAFAASRPGNVHLLYEGSDDIWSGSVVAGQIERKSLILGQPTGRRRINGRLYVGGAVVATNSCEFNIEPPTDTPTATLTPTTPATRRATITATNTPSRTRAPTSAPTRTPYVEPTPVVAPTLMPPTPTTLATPPANTPGTLANISTRGMVGTGDKVMIGGFIVRGGYVSVILRARGGSLRAAGVDGVLSDPHLRLYSGQTAIAENDNWESGNCRTEASQGLRPTDPLDACLAMTLAPGPYTAIVSGVGGTTGIAIVEAFNTGGSGDFSNISTRGDVLSGDRVMIGGFIIGRSPVKVVLMGRGPSMTALGVPGVLCDPKLRLYSGQSEIGGNDDWGSGNCGAQLPSLPRPADARESCLAVTLPPGPYTAILSSQEVCQGIGIVEVFHAGQ